MTAPTVLVTGAARGIGRQVARRFHAEGWRVGAYDVDEVGVRALAEELGPGVVTGALDVRDPDAWTAVLESLTAPAGGRLDVLVNNAGVLRSGEFVSIPVSEQRLMLEVNVLGVLQGCHAAHPHLARARGTVVNLCSASAVYGQPELATYSATKFAVRGLTEALDLEWAADGIRVRAVWPLFVDTAMVQGMDIGSTRTLGVHLTPEEVADAVYATVRPRRPLLGGVHRGVGRQATAMLTASQVTPSWLLRQVTRRISGR